MESPLGDYLRARRAELRPEDVGSRSAPGRRVAGLRRDEVAELAGISSEYYLRLEQGRGHQPSEQVIRSLARALRLDGAAVQYMLRLVRIQAGVRRPADPVARAAWEPSLEALLTQWPTTPAYVTDRLQTVVLRNDLAAAILPGAPAPGSNLLLGMFSGTWRAALADWEASARRMVAAVRYSADPADPALHDIVGLLSMRDADFRRFWALHEAAPLESAVLRFDVPGIGQVEFWQQCLSPAGDGEHVLSVFHAASGTSAADAVRSLRAAQAGALEAAS